MYNAGTTSAFGGAAAADTDIGDNVNNSNENDSNENFSHENDRNNNNEGDGLPHLPALVWQLGTASLVLGPQSVGLVVCSHGVYV